jgi:hypothetical protein
MVWARPAIGVAHGWLAACLASSFLVREIHDDVNITYQKKTGTTAHRGNVYPPSDAA